MRLHISNVLGSNKLIPTVRRGPLTCFAVLLLNYSSRYDCFSSFAQTPLSMLLTCSTAGISSFSTFLYLCPTYYVVDLRRYL